MSLIHVLAYLNKFTYEGTSLSTILGHQINLTGIVMFFMLFILWISSQPALKSKRKFEVFYYSHFLLFPITYLLYCHAPQFILYCGGATLGYLIDRIVRFYNMFFSLKVLSIIEWPDDVTELQIERPPNFRYSPGDYVYLCIFRSSYFEWHPFTITSTPLELKYISLHIRRMGNWTRKLADLKENEISKVYIDGPLGTPSSYLMQKNNLILIAAGIGVTPFISFLRTLSRTKFNKKIYFVWVARSITSFAWTESLMEILTNDNIQFKNIKIQLYIDQDDPQIKSFANTLINAEVPNWNRIFSDIILEKSDHKFEVFYSGPPGLSKVLELISAQYGLPYQTEIF